MNLVKRSFGAVDPALVTALETMADQGLLQSMDLHLGRQLLEWHGQADMAEPLLVSSVLLSWSLARGQVCLPLQHCPLMDFRPWWPTATGWQQLAGLPLVWSVHSDQTQPAAEVPGWLGQPLVLEWRQQRPVRLYLARYFFYQQGVAASIRQRLLPQAVDARQLSGLLQQLFPPAASASTDLLAEPVVDWQAVAAASACLQGFCVITGGPGTGKTTTVTRLLCALLGLNPGLGIALAAPTGKAAARMLESIRQTRQREKLPGAERIPDESFTLHRLLGWTPNGFRYGPERPLPWDCVVVDEASMVDLAMMHQLLSALAPGARLILLGDKDQLASVEAGSVLADMCRSGDTPGPSPAFAAQLQDLLGYDLTPWTTAALAPMQNAVAQLRVSRRFDANSGIGQLATAVNHGDVRSALEAFKRSGDIQFDSQYLTDAPGNALLPWQQALLDGYRAYGQALQTEQSPAELLKLFGRFRVLVALRQGAYGVEQVNRQIEELLSRAGWLKRSRLSPWYHGRPVMITRNDYDLGLFNGDIGILMNMANGDHRVVFESSEGEIRQFLPSRLPAHETSFAMTVHKSQGSEFDSVQLVLPPQWQAVITRELVYTAITRAKSRFRLLASPECWQKALSSRVERASGLTDILWSQ